MGAGRGEGAFVLAGASFLAGVRGAVLGAAGVAARRIATIQWRQHEGFDVAGYVLDPRTIFTDIAADAAGGGLTGDVVRRAVGRAGQVAARSGTPVFDQEPAGELILLVGAAPVDPATPARGAAVVGGVVRSDLKTSLEGIEAADRAYAEVRAQRRELLRLYDSIIALVGLGNVFVASWIGFYVSLGI